MGRVSYLADSDGTVLANYEYLGLDDIDYVNNPQPGITLDSRPEERIAANWTMSISSTGPRTWFSRRSARRTLTSSSTVTIFLEMISGRPSPPRPPTASAGRAFRLQRPERVDRRQQGTLNGTDTAITANLSRGVGRLDGMGNWSTFTQTGGIRARQRPATEHERARTRLRTTTAPRPGPCPAMTRPAI